MKQIINSEQAPKAIGPYNHANKGCGLLFVSGQIALNPATNELILHDIAAETHQVLHNLKTIVTTAGLTLEDVVKCTVFVLDMANYAAINSVYAMYFAEETAPARELVQVSGLPRGVNVEISAIAAY
jgi:2-iminobutanoate/2-iminopropanoate deaminase